MSNIIVPIVNLKLKVGGFVKLRAHKLDGTSRDLTGWFPNLVVDTGLERIGTGSYLGACHVGTSTTAPANGDTTVGGYLAGTTTGHSNSSGAQASEPYYGWRLITWRFALGAVVGNVGSVAIATAAANGGTTILFSRARVLDELGDPTTVAVAVDEVLDVTYELRLYPPLSDYLQNAVNIPGSGVHDIILRASIVTSQNPWGQWLGSQASFTPTSASSIFYNGAIGAITGTPAGVNYAGNPENAAYAATSKERAATIALGLDNANFAGGIRSWGFRTTLGAFQMQFTPAIMKIDTKTVTLTAKIAWARNV